MILEGIDLAATSTQRMYWAEADQHAQALLEFLRGTPGVAQIAAAGSYRRGRETVGDLDILVDSVDVAAVMDRLAEYDAAEVIARGDTKMSVRVAAGLQVDLRVVPPESFGAALQYFTGSKEHNVILRGLAKNRGLKINEYGVYRLAGDEEQYLAGRTEADVYATLDLPVFPPEIREGRFEFQWAAAGPLPQLVELDDLVGDLHMHTNATDGNATLEEMVAAARARGLAYIAITDHSQRVSMANGLDERRLREQWARIDKLNATLQGFRVLKGVEVDILERGGLDIADDCLAEADWVVASIHYGQNQPREQITARMLDAVTNPHVSAIAHPTGRLINRRKPYDVDMEARVLRRGRTGQMHGAERQSGPARPGRRSLRRRQIAGHSDRHFQRFAQRRRVWRAAVRHPASPAGRPDRCRRGQHATLGGRAEASRPRGKNRTVNRMSELLCAARCFTMNGYGSSERVAARRIGETWKATSSSFPIWRPAIRRPQRCRPVLGRRLCPRGCPSNARLPPIRRPRAPNS